MCPGGGFITLAWQLGEGSTILPIRPSPPRASIELILINCNIISNQLPNLTIPAITLQLRRFVVTFSADVTIYNLSIF